MSCRGLYLFNLKAVIPDLLPLFGFRWLLIQNIFCSIGQVWLFLNNTLYEEQKEDFKQSIFDKC